MLKVAAPNPWVIDQFAGNQVWQKEFLKRLGLTGVKVRFFARAEDLKNVMVWKGRGDITFRHEFEWDAASCSDDEIAAIKVKVKLSTC